MRKKAVLCLISSFILLNSVCFLAGTLTSIVSGGPTAGLQGQGTWQQTVDDHFLYKLEEPVIENGRLDRIIYSTNHAYLTHGGNTFEGEGQSTLRTPDGKVLALCNGIFAAKRAPQDGGEQRRLHQHKEERDDTHS